MDKGEGRARFYCLAFAPVKYRQPKAPRFSAVLGLYFCSHRKFTRFSVSSYGEDGRLLSYTRGVDAHDTLEFVLLHQLLECAIHPAFWRLFPRKKIVKAPEEYESARRALCRLLFHFRAIENAKRCMAGRPNVPLMICDETVPLLALGDSKEEDAEIEAAVLSAGKNQVR